MSLAPGDLLTVQQALQILPVAKSMIYRLIEEGQIRSIRAKSVGSRRGRILIFRSALEDYVRRQEAKAPARPTASVNVDELRDQVRTRHRTHTDVASTQEAKHDATA